MYVDVCYDSYVIYELVVHMHTTRTSTRVVLLLVRARTLVVLEYYAYYLVLYAYSCSTNTSGVPLHSLSFSPSALTFNVNVKEELDHCIWVLLLIIA